MGQAAVLVDEQAMIDRSFQIGDHFVARNTDHGAVIRGTIFDIDKEYYYVDWGDRGKKLVPISWVESLKPWTLTYRPARETINERLEIRRNQHEHD